MQHRKSTVENFSTFIQFDLDRFNGWMTDAKLRRSMIICLENSSKQESNNFWALYWYKVWQTQSNSLAIAHICAYLQEACYWAAKKSMLNFSGHSTLADYFQIAIAHIDKILKGFNPEYSSHLKSYAQLSFERIIRDVLRVRREADICSNWGLLHKISRKRLIKSLENMGLNNQNIENYVLAWECFRELDTRDNKKTRKLTKPNADTLQAITNLYNTQRLSRLSAASPAVNSQTIEKWLLYCPQAIRNFLYPKIISADTPLKDDGDATLLDTLPQDLQNSLLTEIIEQEEVANFTNQQTQLNQVLNQAITALDAKSQRLLQFYYTQQLTQTEIAKQLEIKQYQVSRLLSKIRKSLLLSISQWSEKTLHISLTSDVIACINISLEEWLKFHYCQTEQG